MAYPIAMVVAAARPDAATIRIGPALRASRPKTARYFRVVDYLHRDYRNCENDIGTYRAALLHRVYVASTPWNPPSGFQKVLRTAASRLGRQLPAPQGPDGFEESLRKFPPRKRELYRNARNEEWTTAMSGVTGFVKDEWCPVKPGKFFKPRAIQFRDPRYLAHSMEYFEPIEHAFYRGRYLFNRHQKYTCAKGANPHNRIGYIRRLVSELEGCHVVGLDGSAFDAHVVPAALRAEWKFYCLAAQGAGWSPDLIRKMNLMGKQQLRNKCYARLKDGTIKYKVDGNRMSGDKNTGLGNSVLQSCYVAASMDALGIEEGRWRMYVDGDDALLFVSGSEVHKLTETVVVGGVRMRALEAVFTRFSQEVKMEEPLPVDADNLENIEFCQARPVRVNGRWRLVRSPLKVYNTYFRSRSWFSTVSSAQRYFATVCPPEMIINADVPVLDAMFRQMYKLASGKPIESVARNFWRRTVEWSSLKHYEPRGVIDTDTRLSFEKAFGMSPFEQFMIEEEFLRGLTPEALSQLGDLGIENPRSTCTNL